MSNIVSIDRYRPDYEPPPRQNNEETICLGCLGELLRDIADDSADLVVKARLFDVADNPLTALAHRGSER